MEQIDLSTEPKGYKLSLKEPIRCWSGGVQELHVSGEVLIIREKEELRLYIKDKKEWDGAGLPPVGTECKFGDEMVKIIAHVDQENGDPDYRFLAVAQIGEKGSIIYGPEKLFKPIRTPEQIAAEQRAKDIFEIAHILIDNRKECTEYHQAGLIYDAGYRKFEIVPE